MIRCAVATLVLYFHLFFMSLVDWIRIASLSVRPITLLGHVKHADL
jgi:hypothetical protein